MGEQIKRTRVRVNVTPKWWRAEQTDARVGAAVSAILEVWKTAEVVIDRNRLVAVIRIADDARLTDYLKGRRAIGQSLANVLLLHR